MQIAGWAAVPEVPGPGGDGPGSGRGLVDELDIGGGAGERKIRGEGGGGEGEDGDIIRFSDRIRSARVPHNKRDGIRAGCDVRDRWILQGRGLSVAKIPLPEIRVIC